MHFEVPKAKTFKEFSGEYLMIVISILTALALEQGLEYLHHRHLAHEAADKMNVELRANIMEVATALEYNEKKRLALRQAREQLLAGIRGKTSDAELMKHYEQEWAEAIRLNMSTPILRREAWETAVANQAVTWLPNETLERYAAAYSALRETSTSSQAMRFVDLPRMMDTLSNARMGTSNPQEIYRTATQIVSVYDNLDDNLKSLTKLLQTVVDENGGAHAGKPKH
jgi:acyl carrier protein phosphodiesterase